MPTNYKQLFAIQKRLEEQVKMACPNMKHQAGIYFYIRKDEEGKHCYIGQSQDCLKRCASHMHGYQHIDISLRKRGFYSPDNTTGWELNVLYFPENMLNEKEQYYIDAYTKAGYDVYNIESGGTTGKTMINERKPARGYMDGLKQGRKTVCRDLKNLLDKYLVVSLKVESRHAQNGLDKFWKIINENTGE